MRRRRIGWPGRIGAILAGLFLSVTAAGAQDQVTELTLDDARALGRAALVQNRPELALAVGRGLLQADPADADAHLMVSAAEVQLRRAGPGRRAARLAYRHADTRPQKFQASMLAARHALADERMTLSQFWLRRASIHAGSEAARARIATDYRKVRAANPWSFQFDFALRPTSNVNNGANTAIHVVDGIDLVGSLSGSAQALSGVVASTDAELGYRLRGTADNRTTLSGRVIVQRVRLSREARALAPEVENGDFGSTYGEISLTHAFRVGEARGETAILTAAFGGAWYGGDFSDRVWRLDAQRRGRLGARTGWMLGGTVLARDVPGSERQDRLSVDLRGGISHALASGDRVSLSLGLQATESDTANDRFRAARLRLGYSFADQMGPARISTALVLSASSHDDYLTLGITPLGGLAVMPVPGGRQDHAVHASLTAAFPDYDYAGFAPEVTLRAGRRASNVSRFDSTELSVSFGMQSKF